uniref:Uncharacterized protein n=1 Tax=Nelumbo nucifera TaxID=4432 RepID=A0A822YUL6_NELNU|nr:TPA_asm: hypothetical protein HUJ06_011789 [Nelumbo nucifera]
MGFDLRSRQSQYFTQNPIAKPVDRRMEVIHSYLNPDLRCGGHPHREEGGDE